MITVHIPLPLADEFSARSVLTMEAGTCRGVLSHLDAQYPGMASWLAEPDGRFRQHLSVFIAGTRLPVRASVDHSIPDGSEVWILRAISGG